jgi:hypothetical protein
MKKCAPSRPIFSWFALLLSIPGLFLSDVAIAGSGFQPPKSGAPGNREAGAARSDSCASTANSSGLTALLPTSNLGLTTKPFPTFYVFIPANNAQKVEFRLLEEVSGQEIFTGQVSMPKAEMPNADYKHKASIVELALPQTGNPKGLAEGKNYLWALLVVCNAQNRAEDIVITGVVQRIGEEYVKTLDPQIQLKLKSVNRVSAQERLSVYGSAGIWQDLLADVASLMQKNPASYSDNWKTLLSEQGLAAIATTPIVESKLEPLQP